MSSDAVDITSVTFYKLYELSTENNPLIFKKTKDGMEISVGKHTFYGYGHYDLPNTVIEAYATIRAQIEVERHKDDQRLQNSSIVLKI